MKHDPAPTLTIELNNDEHSDYLDRLGRELTADTLRAVERYARDRCQWLTSHNVRTDGLVKHLVCDAVTDTALGVRAWEPNRGLASHLRGVIRGRTFNVLTRSRKFPSTDAAGLIEPTDTAETLGRKDTTRKFVDALTRLARDKDDAIVVQLIETYASGVTKRANVAAALGISLSEHDNARARLARLVLKVPDELREQAHEIALGASTQPPSKWAPVA